MVATLTCDGYTITEGTDVGTLKSNFWWISWSVLVVAQIVLCILFYNWAGIKGLTYVGYAVLIVGFSIGHMSVTALKKKGEAPKGKSWVETTALVDSGIYAAVRYPGYLCWILFSLAIVFISQYWVVAIVGVAAAVTIYMQARQDEQSNTEKFGDDYKRYLGRVPRMNLVVGLIRLLRH